MTWSGQKIPVESVIKIILLIFFDLNFLNIERTDIEATRCRATIAGIAGHPKNVTSGINLNIEFSWRAPQSHTSEIKPE